MRIEGIVFDLDGTLADTEPLHIDTWLVILNNLGLKFDESWMHQWIGLSDRLVAEHVCEHFLKNQSVEFVMEHPYPEVSYDTPVERLSSLITRENGAVLSKDEAGSYHIVTKYDIIQSLAK